MGDRIIDLTVAVDLLRRRVQEQAQTIEAQGKKIAQLQRALPNQEQEIMIRRGNRAHAHAMNLLSAVHEIQEKLWPGRLVQEIEAERAQDEADKLHADERNGD